MRRFMIFAVLIIPLLLCSCGLLVSGNTATLCCDGKTYILTQEETARVSTYLAQGNYLLGGAGCPFSEGYSIVFDGKTICVSQDDCETVRIAGTEKYYALSPEAMAYIEDLFTKYRTS